MRAKMTPEGAGCGCVTCPFSIKGKPGRYVLASGDPTTAAGVLVGDCPSREDSESGRMFSGFSGKELRKELESNGLDCDSLYGVNAIACRPLTGNPADFRRAAKACSPLFVAQMAKVQDTTPILLLGQWAWWAMIGKKKSLKKGRGFVREIPVPRKHFGKKVKNAKKDGAVGGVVSTGSDDGAGHSQS